MKRTLAVILALLVFAVPALSNVASAQTPFKAIREKATEFGKKIIGDEETREAREGRAQQEGDTDGDREVENTDLGNSFGSFEVRRRELERVRTMTPGDAQEGLIKAQERETRYERAREIEREAREERRALKEKALQMTGEVQRSPDARRQAVEAIKARREAYQQKAARMKEIREEKKNSFAELAQERREEFQTRIRETVSEKKKEIAQHVLEMLTGLKERMLNHFLDVLGRLETVLTNITTRTDKAVQVGILDEEAADEVYGKIEEAHEAITDARELTEAQFEVVYSPETEINNETELKDVIGEMRDALRDDLEEVREAVRDAFEAVREAAVTLAQKPRVDEAEVEEEAGNEGEGEETETE